MLAAAFTVNDILQLIPAKLIAKLAMPDEAGVPETENDKLPVPFANVPACNVAVNPVTPVEGIDAPAA